MRTSAIRHATLLNRLNFKRLALANVRAAKPADSSRSFAPAGRPTRRDPRAFRASMGHSGSAASRVGAIRIPAARSLSISTLPSHCPCRPTEQDFAESARPGVSVCPVMRQSGPWPLSQNTTPRQVGKNNISGNLALASVVLLAQPMHQGARLKS